MPDKPQDIFEEVEPVKDAQVNQRPVIKPPLVIPKALSNQPSPSKSVFSSRWPLLVGGLIILLIGIAAVVVFLRRSPVAPTANLNIQNVSVTAGSVSGENANTQTTPAGALQEVITNDKDRDGLTDEEEQKLGTNNAVADTDGDGLSDYDEVNVYKTNPKVPDTDGDGNTDGAEVKMGYNPIGAGKLLDFEAARQKLNK